MSRICGCLVECCKVALVDQNVNDFVGDLCAEIYDSAAINHPYLSALSSGELPSFDRALQDFAFQYGVYCGEFAHYVSAVIENLNDPIHKRILLSNLEEEQGKVEDLELPDDVLASIVGRPHSSLFRRFQQALNVSDEADAEHCAARWSQNFLTLCQMNECAGVGAIGLGTEMIVSRIYDQILCGLKAHSSLTMTERVFFDLHSHCDEEHAAQVLVIARDLAQDATSRKQIEYGARTAIELRVAFWDEMLERAHSFPVTDVSRSKKSLAY